MPTNSDCQTDAEQAPVRVLHYFAFPGGGIGRYVHELLNCMVEQPGLEIELACIPSYHYRRSAKYPLWPGLREITHHVPWRRRLRFAINLVVNPLRAIRRARRTGAQIIHLSTIPHVTFGLWSRALRGSGLKLVATAHDVRRSHGLIWHSYEVEQLKRLYRSCEAIFVHSEYQRQDLVDFAGVSASRVVVVPHGPYYHGPPTASKEELRRRYGVPLDKQVALFFGDIRADKNLDLFLQAMTPYKDRLFLVVAGRIKGPKAYPLEYYQRIAAQNGITEVVRFDIRFIPDDEVADLFTLADWVALPYGRSFTSQSGVLNVAVAYRRPVLASGCGTFRETIGAYEVGIVVPPDDVAELIAGIRTMMARYEQPWDFDGYSKAMSWFQNAGRTAKLYTTVASSTGPATEQVSHAK